MVMQAGLVCFLTEQYRAEREQSNIRACRAGGRGQRAEPNLGDPIVQIGDDSGDGGKDPRLGGRQCLVGSPLSTLNNDVGHPVWQSCARCRDPTSERGLGLKSTTAVHNSAALRAYVVAVIYGKLCGHAGDQMLLLFCIACSAGFRSNNHESYIALTAGQIC